MGGLFLAVASGGLVVSAPHLLASRHAQHFVASVQPVRAAACSLQLVSAERAADLLDEVDKGALALDAAAGNAASPPRRGADGRLLPVLTLPGDTLETSALMVAITAASTLLFAGVVLRAFVLGGSPLWPLLGVVFGGIAGELFSGTFHWATDNYGGLETPVVGFACAAFQGHHLAPWTISYRSVYNNVYKIAAATLPLVSAAVAFLPPAGAAAVATMLYCQLLAQEFHRWTHMPPKLLAGWQRRLQKRGIALPFTEHCAHHKPPFDKHYCILTGGLNGLLDSPPVYFWRRLEAFFYRLNGIEPNSWKDARVKELALRL